MDFATIGLRSDTRGLLDAQRELRNLTSQGDQTERRVTQATNMMDRGFRGVGLAAAKMAGALTGAFLSGRWLVGAIRDSEELERTMMRTQAIINATGGIAGRTADQLRRQADELGRATLADERQILRVQQQLLTFRNIRGEVFDDAIAAALDLSEAMGIDLSGAAMQVARALEDPVRGVTALTRSGTVFSQSQREMIAAMVAAGDTAGAQRLILQELEAQYGGAATAAAQGLGGSLDALRQNMRDLGREFVSATGMMRGTERLVAGLGRAAGGAAAFLRDDLGGALEAATNMMRGAGAVAVALASTQIPAVTAALIAKTAALVGATSALSLMTIQMYAGAAASVAMSTAARGLAVALALVGGPLGLLLGITGGLAAAMVLFRDKTETVVPIVDEAARAVGEINRVLATSSEHALPEASRATLNLTNENIKLAKSAYEAARAEIAKAEAAAYAAQQQLGAETMSSLPFETLPGYAENQRAIDNLIAKRRELSAAEADLTARINEGQLSLTEAAEAMAENQRRAIELSISMDDLAGSNGRVAKAADELTEAQRRALAVIAQMNSDAVTQEQVIAALEQMYLSGAISADQLAEAIRRVKIEMGESSEIAQQLESAFESAFTGFLTGAQSAKQAAAQLLQQLAKLLANSAFQSLFGGAFSSGGLFAGFFDKGGTIPSGQFGVVGEYGPEIVKGPAHVTGREQTARMMGGRDSGKLSISIGFDRSMGGFKAEVLDETGQMMAQGFQQYDREVLPRRVAQVSRDPRAVGK